MYLQTGDVLYFGIDSIPKGSKKIKTSIVHEGRDHHHTISGKFEILKNGDDLFIKAAGPCKLLHPEHKTIELPKGLFKKGIVNEYDHFLEESRKVID